MAFQDQLVYSLLSVILLGFFQGCDGAYRSYSYRSYRSYSYRSYSYYYGYDYVYLSGGVIAGIVCGVIFFVVFIIVIVICCCRAASQRNRMPGIVYSNGMNQQTVITTANTTPGMYPTQPYPAAGQNNMGFQYGVPGQQFGVPGQQFGAPGQQFGAPDQQATNPQYTNPAPSYESVTQEKNASAPPYST